MVFGSGGFPTRASSDGSGECSRVEKVDRGLGGHNHGSSRPPFVFAAAWAATCGSTATEREHAWAWVRSLEGTILAMMLVAWGGT
ncbi:hypothetical protein GUJ93_ZPchr0007g5801 [Zizania palustris]|uniref:Uncharacterized protein n=1 Tax=Zizania palustris TaxID=103762 RepID=A0A8J5SRX9_ZIZPA|nr:hypothetical protein GUJ93_ZPchr0007g5801 [Zizania palustris]